MHEFEIDRVSRSPMGNKHEHITHIGNSTGKWRLSRADAIAQIDVKASRFYLKDRLSGRPVYLAVVRHGKEMPVLRAKVHEEWSDTLITLPECEAECRTL